MGIEPMTSSLPRKRSTPELHWLTESGRRGSNSRPSAWKADALPTELLPQYKMWGEQDSNLRRRTPADLQSAPVGHFGISPSNIISKIRADGGIRTPDQLITNQLLWPTELHRHYYCTPFQLKDCKDIGFWLNSKNFFRLKTSIPLCKPKTLLSRLLQLWRISTTKPISRSWSPFL